MDIKQSPTNLGLSVLVVCFDSDDISKHHAIQTRRISSKMLRCASFFQLSSRCWDVPMKHCLSYLICYVKTALFHMNRLKFPESVWWCTDRVAIS